MQVRFPGQRATELVYSLRTLPDNIRIVDDPDTEGHLMFDSQRQVDLTPQLRLAPWDPPGNRQRLDGLLKTFQRGFDEDFVVF